MRFISRGGACAARAGDLRQTGSTIPCRRRRSGRARRPRDPRARRAPTCGRANQARRARGGRRRSAGRPRGRTHRHAGRGDLATRLIQGASARAVQRGRRAPSPPGRADRAVAGSRTGPCRLRALAGLQMARRQAGLNSAQPGGLPRRRHAPDPKFRPDPELPGQWRGAPALQPPTRAGSAGPGGERAGLTFGECARAVSQRPAKPALHQSGYARDRTPPAAELALLFAGSGQNAAAPRRAVHGAQDHARRKAWCASGRQKRPLSAEGADEGAVAELKRSGDAAADVDAGRSQSLQREVAGPWRRSRRRSDRAARAATWPRRAGEGELRDDGVLGSEHQPMWRQTSGVWGVLCTAERAECRGPETTRAPSSRGRSARSDARGRRSARRRAVAVGVATLGVRRDAGVAGRRRQRIGSPRRSAGAGGDQRHVASSARVAPPFSYGMKAAGGSVARCRAPSPRRSPFIMRTTRFRGRARRASWKWSPIVQPRRLAARERPPATGPADVARATRLPLASRRRARGTCARPADARSMVAVPDRRFRRFGASARRRPRCRRAGGPRLGPAHVGGDERDRFIARPRHQRRTRRRSARRSWSFVSARWRGSWSPRARTRWRICERLPELDSPLVETSRRPQTAPRVGRRCVCS